MIQRIQTIYLVLATLCMVLALFLPLAILGSPVDTFTLLAQGIYNAENILMYPTWGIIAIGGLVALLCLVTIMLYKKRKMQVKLCYTAILGAIFFYATIATYLFVGEWKVEAAFTRIGFGITFPVIAIILVLLAVKGIKADEKLVRSLDRIR